MTMVIRRIFQLLNNYNFIPLYKALVRSHLDYANSVWFPYKKSQIMAVENVQRRATKQLPGLKHLAYKIRLKTLNLPTLAYRRLRGDMIEVYKILHTIYYDNEVSPKLAIYNERVTRIGNRGHILKLFAQRAQKIYGSMPSH